MSCILPLISNPLCVLYTNISLSILLTNKKVLLRNCKRLTDHGRGVCLFPDRGRSTLTCPPVWGERGTLICIPVWGGVPLSFSGVSHLPPSSPSPLGPETGVPTPPSGHITNLKIYPSVVLCTLVVIITQRYSFLKKLQLLDWP